MENYNAKVREIVENWVETGNNAGIDSKKFIDILIPFIGDFFNEDTDNLSNKIITTYLLEVAFLDAYKMYSYRQKECLKSDYDEEIFAILNDIEDFEDLFKTVCEDQDFFAAIILAVYDFASLDYLGKSRIMKSLSEEENGYLTDMFPINEQDVITYNKKVDLSTIINYINERTIYQNKIESMDFPGGILANVLGYVRNLIVLDYSNAISLLGEIGQVDYAVSKFIITKDSLEEEDKESILEHIDLYENYPLDEILARLITDQDFLKDAIWMVASGIVYNYFDGIEIDKAALKTEDIEKVTKKFVLNDKKRN